MKDQPVLFDEKHGQNSAAGSALQNLFDSLVVDQ